MEEVGSGGLVCDPTIRQQWSLLNRFRTPAEGNDTDLCPCGETQTMSHIVESCPLTKLNGGLSRVHCADEDAVSQLTSNDMHTRRRRSSLVCLRLVRVNICLKHSSGRFIGSAATRDQWS